MTCIVQSLKTFIACLFMPTFRASSLQNREGNNKMLKLTIKFKVTLTWKFIPLSVVPVFLISKILRKIIYGPLK